MLWHLIFILLIIAHAAIDAYLIKRNTKINHILESVLFGICWAAITYFLKVDLKQSMLFIVVARTGIFDFALNKFRGLKFAYISPNVNGNYNGKFESRWDEVIGKYANYIRTTALLTTIIIICYN
jgi:hypothetical protein